MTARAPLLLLLVLVLVLAATALAAIPAGAHTTGSHDATWLENHRSAFIERMWNKRGQLRRIKADKCRPRPTFKRLPGEILPAWRKHRLEWIRFRVERARGYSSRCVSYHHESLWQCVHDHEGAWNDPNAPYFGGLQMGYWFMETYAPRLYAAKGTADHWTPGEQMQVADRAYHNAGHSLGWLDGQWPGTTSECGGVLR
jgi:hypothetical protein